MAGGGGLAPLSVACPLCGRHDFPSGAELERHAASCRGALEPDRLDARTLMAPTQERRRREGAGAAPTGAKPAKKATLDEYLADDTEELCAFCGRPKEDAPSRLIFSGSAEGGMFCAHVLCALYNSGVGPETDESGPSIAAASLKELDRARQYKLNCTLCKKRRALIGCIAKGCKRSFHFPCARELFRDGRAHFLLNERSVACYEHRAALEVRGPLEKNTPFNGVWFEYFDDSSDGDGAVAAGAGAGSSRAAAAAAAAAQPDSRRTKSDRTRAALKRAADVSDDERRPEKAARHAISESDGTDEDGIAAMMPIAAHGAPAARGGEPTSSNGLLPAGTAPIIPPDVVLELFSNPPTRLLGHALSRGQLSRAREWMREARKRHAGATLAQTIRILGTPPANSGAAKEWAAQAKGVQEGVLKCAGVLPTLKLSSVLDQPDTVLSRAAPPGALCAEELVSIAADSNVLMARSSLRARQVLAPIGGTVLTEAEYADQVRHAASIDLRSHADLLKRDAKLEASSILVQGNDGSAAQSSVLMQGVEDASGVPLDRCVQPPMTGAAHNPAKQPVFTFHAEVMGVPLRFLAVANDDVSAGAKLELPMDAAKEDVKRSMEDALASFDRGIHV